ncbi:phosphatidylserine decarboxylase family protein [Emticicia sp. TH156]|uniref:phosphatidylserine decarboxylase family protein n=1 Tax=Emticicia sp. TH156 TaxID=2067454 RepID=UPI000C7783B0|nr:phosphatidylserine decarboxylase family protein [Emticicia sp. TH156]PLK43296.1 phosphatidylserine decarboxylase [Emticicia sp. TH156]
MLPQSYVPFNIQSGWIPNPDRESFRIFFESVLNTKPKNLAPSIKALKKLIEGDEVLTYLANNAFQQNDNIIQAHQSTKEAPIPRIPDLDTLLNAFNTILSLAPQFINNDLVGLPFSALVVGIDATLGGSTMFRIPKFNEKMKAILEEWGKFLVTPASAVGFSKENEQWLSPAAKKQYDFPLWKKDSQTLPYWKSWDSFFTRDFLDPKKSRPIASPNTNQVVICPNDGSLFCWQPKVQKRDVFWLKGMPYSLNDIFSSPDRRQNEIIRSYKLDEMFENGYVFQTYLNPYNFHRWWVPVNGKVLFDPIVIPGCFFSKLVLPDYGGATTASTPYLAEVNAKGLIVFETEDYGNVCCIPLGMSEVSSVVFDKQLKKGAHVTKGQEMGMFHYGGSSFVVIYQNLPDKQLIFMDSDGNPYPQQPPPPGSSAGASNYGTNIGSQIGQWYCKC